MSAASKPATGYKPGWMYGFSIVMALAVISYALLYAARAAGYGLTLLPLWQLPPAIPLAVAGLTVVMGVTPLVRLGRAYRAREKKLHGYQQQVAQAIASVQPGKKAQQTNLPLTDPAGKALHQLVQRLDTLAAQEQLRTWHSQGLAQALDVLRGNTQLQKCAQELITTLVRYTGAAQAALFLVDAGGQPSLAAHCVGANLQPLAQELATGHGLVGVIVQRPQTLHLTGLPSNYFYITSGLGQATPAALLLVPMLFEGMLHGVVELASFSAFEPHTIQLVEEIAGRAAATFYHLNSHATTERMLQEARALTESLTRQEEDLRLRDRAITASSSGVIITDASQPGNPILYVNPAFEHISGYTAAESLGKSCRFLQGKDTDQPELVLLREAIHAGKDCQVLLRNYRKDGTLFWNDLRISPLRDAQGKLTHFIGIQNDVTAHKEAEQAVLQLNEELEGRVATRTQELAATLEELRATQDRMVQSEKLASLGQLVAGVAHEINTPIGAVKAAAVNMGDYLPQALRLLPGILVSLGPAYVPLFNHMLEEALATQELGSTREERRLRREIQQQLEANGLADAQDCASELVGMGLCAGYSRYLCLLQLPNGLQVVRTAGYLVQLKRSLEVINSAVDKTRKTVHALKRFAHFQIEEKMEPVDLKDSLEVVLTLYANQMKQGIEVVRHYQSVKPILGYGDELGQVWTNLIHNAIQAMDYRGTLTLELDGAEHAATVRIVDSGCGIPKEVLPRIFEPFFTTKPQGEGSGLGLDIVRKIIEKHGGSIQVASQPGRTAFEVCLPYMPAIPEQQIDSSPLSLAA